MFTSHKQISPPSLVLKLKISEVSQKWIPKAVELKRIPTHKKCKCKKFCSQTRLVGEIYSSDVIMHRGYCLLTVLKCKNIRKIVRPHAHIFSNYSKLYFYYFAKNCGAKTRLLLIKIKIARCQSEVALTTLAILFLYLCTVLVLCGHC